MKNISERKRLLPNATERKHIDKEINRYCYRKKSQIQNQVRGKNRVAVRNKNQFLQKRKKAFKTLLPFDFEFYVLSCHIYLRSKYFMKR